LHILKQVDQPSSRRMATLSTLWVERQAFNRLAIHDATPLAFK
jgi:hypothetical protein